MTEKDIFRSPKANPETKINFAHTMSKKFYTEKQTAIAAALAGPIPAGILIFLNYRALGKDREAIVSLAFTLFFSTIIFSLIFYLP